MVGSEVVHLGEQVADASRDDTSLLPGAGDLVVGGCSAHDMSLTCSCLPICKHLHHTQGVKLLYSSVQLQAGLNWGGRVPLGAHRCIEAGQESVQQGLHELGEQAALGQHSVQQVGAFHLEGHPLRVGPCGAPCCCSWRQDNGVVIGDMTAGFCAASLLVGQNWPHLRRTKLGIVCCTRQGRQSEFR